jgi:hypothetical protein
VIYLKNVAMIVGYVTYWLLAIVVVTAVVKFVWSAI